MAHTFKDAPEQQHVADHRDLTVTCPACEEGHRAIVRRATAYTSPWVRRAQANRLPASDRTFGR